MITRQRQRSWRKGFQAIQLSAESALRFLSRSLLRRIMLMSVILDVPATIFQDTRMRALRMREWKRFAYCKQTALRLRLGC